MWSKFATSILLFSSVFSLIAHADDLPKDERDEYDFSWLDPDKKINVVQNRKYLKGHSVEVVLDGGIGLGQSYRTTRLLSPRMTYYFNESWGITAVGGWVTNREDDDMIALRQIAFNGGGNGVIPSVRELNHYYGGAIKWVPFYAKINTFNHIFYLDWDFNFGVAAVESQIDVNNRVTGSPAIVLANYTGYFWGTGQKFFIDRNWGVHIDFMSLYYAAPTAFNGILTTQNQTETNYFLSLGLSYTF
jgi:outer membrane beta-barrel protein